MVIVIHANWLKLNGELRLICNITFFINLSNFELVIISFVVHVIIYERGKN